MLRASSLQLSYDYDLDPSLSTGIFGADHLLTRRQSLLAWSSLRVAESKHGYLSVPGLDTRGFFVDDRFSGALRPTPRQVSDHIKWVNAGYISDSQRFRFRRCPADRRFWVSVAAVSETKRSRFERFCDCGKAWFFEYSPCRSAYRLRVKTCENRFCPVCCLRLGKERIDKLAEPLQGLKGLKFITLTLQHSSDPLPAQVKHLKDSFRRLRQTKLWRSHYGNGIAVMEIKLTNKLEWHPHLHIIISGSYLRKNLLSEQWRICSRGSMIIDVQAVRHTDKAVEYVAKYVAKPCRSALLFKHPERAIELYLALQRVHTCWPIGDRSIWRKERQAPEPVAMEQSRNDWIVVCNFRDFVAGLKSGSAYHEMLASSCGVDVSAYISWSGG